MIEIFKNWIISMLCLGIFTVIIQLIIPKTNLRKYIYTLIGVITVLTIISPVVNMLKKDSIESSVSQVLASLSSTEDKELKLDDVKNNSDKVVKEQFIKKIKEDIKSKLELKGIIVNSVDIKVANNYDVEKITIKVKKIGNDNTMKSVNSIVTYIHNEYQIEYSKITVSEEGI